MILEDLQKFLWGLLGNVIKKRYKWIQVVDEICSKNKNYFIFKTLDKMECHCFNKKYFVIFSMKVFLFFK